ncbi:sporulation membrane protein YtrI [Thalassobacillus hwangdonensis]|uniref:Sporulation membrane protein YtrI n=1 Tax=Thalassobacillus hwangdonensis TaxID=546108 RepID=A0ABW3KYR7_9BACI
MHIPPYYKKGSWQRFFAGMLAGAFVAYALFIYISGNLLEHWVEENITLRGELSELESTYNNLLETHEKEKDHYIIQEMDVIFSSSRNLSIDRLTRHQLEGLIKAEIQDTIGKGVEEVSNNSNLLIKTIENKRYKVSDLTYQVDVTELTISQVLVIKVNIKQGNSS